MNDELEAATMLTKWWAVISGVVGGFILGAIAMAKQWGRINDHDKDIKALQQNQQEIIKSHKQDIDKVFDRIERITEKHHEMHLSILENVNKGG